MSASVRCCPICGEPGEDLGTTTSSFSQRTFEFCHSPRCGYTFIANPRVDYDALYDSEYYAGRGADRNVEYLQELDDPKTLRQYEWHGVLRVVETLTHGRDLTWLDYGCGLGGLVRYLRDHGVAHAYGFDEGWAAEWMKQHEMPIMTRADLDARQGSFDVVTAIEVIEHVTDPVALVDHISSLLRPGGVFFLTTGNAAPHQGRFFKWSYVNPDVHVGYFQPRTLSIVYAKAGLRPDFAGFLPGYDDIIRYKVLKALRFPHRAKVEQVLPWNLMARVVDWRHGVSAHPIGWRL